MCSTIDLRRLLLQEESPEQIIQRLKTGEDQERKVLFTKLTNWLLSEDIQIALRANMVLFRVAYHKPFQEELKTCFERILNRLLQKDLPPAKIRHQLIRLLEHLIYHSNFNSAYFLDVSTICFNYLEDHRNNYSIKLLPMSILTAICERDKSIQSELKRTVEHQSDIFSFFRKDVINIFESKA